MSFKRAFPYTLFFVYVMFYSGMAVYNTYLNLYLDKVGLDYSQIGTIITISTLCVLPVQLLCGMISDRSKSKTFIVSALLLISALVVLLFNISSSFFYLLLIVSLFAVCFNPISPLLDNYATSRLQGSVWDFGQIRMGGTIGYCITVLVVGLFLDGRYEKIFFLVSLLLIAGVLLSMRLSPLREKNSGRYICFRSLLRNRTLIGLIIFNFSFCLGLNFFYSFYPIYFTTIGGDSSLVGVMIFICAVTEIPMLMVIGRIINKIGIRNALVFAGIITTMRWTLLFLSSNPITAILINALHGVGFTSISYSLVIFISRNVPDDMKATGQSLNALVSSVVSKVVCGYLGGIATESFGPKNVMALSAILMFFSTVVFYLWGRKRKELD